MALQTPRRRGPPRPSLNNTASSPNLYLASSTAIARKASLNALVGGSTTPTNKMGADGQDIEVGDNVDVPGGMNGVVKFVGSVRGKKGVFAGVELSRDFASRGKNDGDVEGYATPCTSFATITFCARTDSVVALDTSRHPFPALAFSCLSTEPPNVLHPP